MKSNKEHFPSRIVIIQFCDKPHQEINFRSHLNSVQLCKQGKILSDLHIFSLILFDFTCLCLGFQIEKCQLWNILVFCNQLKTLSDLNMFHGWFCSISIFWVHFSHKTQKFWFWKSFDRTLTTPLSKTNK